MHKVGWLCGSRSHVCSTFIELKRMAKAEGQKIHFLCGLLYRVLVVSKRESNIYLDHLRTSMDISASHKKVDSVAF